MSLYGVGNGMQNFVMHPPKVVSAKMVILLVHVSLIIYNS
jgi:hypothetical protein